MNSRRKGNSQHHGPPEEGKTGVSWAGSRTLAWREGGRRQVMLGWAGPVPGFLLRWQVVELIPSKLRGGAGFRKAGHDLGTLWKHLWQLQEDRP